MQFIVKPWFIIITFILAFLSGECLSPDQKIMTNEMTLSGRRSSSGQYVKQQAVFEPLDRETLVIYSLCCLLTKLQQIFFFLHFLNFFLYQLIEFCPPQCLSVRRLISVLWFLNVTLMTLLSWRWTCTYGQYMTIVLSSTWTMFNHSRIQNSTAWNLLTRDTVQGYFKYTFSKFWEKNT